MVLLSNLIQTKPEFKHFLTSSKTLYLKIWDSHFQGKTQL